MNTSSLTVLTISGSLRRDSFNKRLLSSAEEASPDHVAFDHYDGLGDLAHFSQDIEGDLTPEPVLELRRRIAAADAVLISTPEYNGAMPGSLKNALDWASRPTGESVFREKPAAAMGASPGRFGAQRSQEAIRNVLAAMGAELLDRELPVPRVHERFDEGDNLADEELEAELRDLVAALIELTGIPAPALAESAEYSLECQRMAA
ncbi:MAG: NADPH-dependent FMN reductase [Solirubrobacterales bacterium]